MIDEKKAMVLGFWKQRSGIVNDETGEEYEILGIGGSWFGVERQVGGADDGLIKFAWQRDWFDMPSTAHTFVEIIKADKAPDTLLERMKVSGLGRARPLPPQGHPVDGLAAAGRARRLHHPAEGAGGDRMSTFLPARSS